MILFIIANNILKIKFMIKVQFCRMFQLKPHLLRINSWSTKFKFLARLPDQNATYRRSTELSFLDIDNFPSLSRSH